LSLCDHLPSRIPGLFHFKSALLIFGYFTYQIRLIDPWMVSISN
jgi:hypothetical protein